MKIFAAAGMYREEASTDVAIEYCGSPVWYEIPDSAISRSGNPFFVPEEGGEYVAFPAAAFRICKLGKSISKRFASRYYDEATIGFSVVAAGLLRELRAASLPWTAAIAFDRSCLLGNFIPISAFKDIQSVEIECGDDRFSYHTADSETSLAEAINVISAGNTLKTGDIILAPLSPKGTILRTGERLTVKSTFSTILDINLK